MTWLLVFLVFSLVICRCVLLFQLKTVPVIDMGQPRRSFKRRIVEGRSSSNKPALVDLNAYPDEVSSGHSMLSVDSTQAVILGTQRDSRAHVSIEPIDVDALEDDVVFVSSRRVPVQVWIIYLFLLVNLLILYCSINHWNQAARRPPVVIDIIDEDSDTNQSSSGIFLLQYEVSWFPLSSFLYIPNGQTQNLPMIALIVSSKSRILFFFFYCKKF